MKKRPLGKFAVSTELLRNGDWTQLKSVFSEVVVVRAQAQFIPDVIEYTAFCSAFDDLEEGLEPPSYTPMMRKCEDGTILLDHWERLDP